MQRAAFVTTLIATSLFAAAGCARTRISSLVAPEARGHTYQRILVIFPVSDLDWRKTAEDEFRNVYSSQGAVFIPSYEVFFPGRQYADEEITALLAEHGVDAALVIALGETGTSTTRTPTQTTARCTVWSSSQGCTAASATTTGGYDISKPWASFTAVLLDVATGSAVWAASARTGGNAFAGTGTLLRSMASRTVGQLRSDGVVA